MGLLARALRPSQSTLGRPPYYSRPSLVDVVLMVPDLITQAPEALPGHRGGPHRHGWVAGDSSEGHFQGSDGPWHASHPGDPLGSAHSWQRHLGASLSSGLH
jgi:hypothetical protein